MANDLIDRTEEWLSTLLTEASTPLTYGQVDGKIECTTPESQIWMIRDKLALASAITSFIGFRQKTRDDQPSKSSFAELKGQMDNAASRPGSARNGTG